MRSPAVEVGFFILLPPNNQCVKFIKKRFGTVVLVHFT
jgi:hypothetical protein